MSETQIIVKAFSKNSPMTMIETSSFKWIIDEPKVFGGSSSAPSPVETMLASLGSCFIATGHLIAKEEKIVIKSMSVEIEGNIDSDVFLGMDKNHRSGFSKITVRIKVDSDADREALLRWESEIATRCPVLDTLIVSPEIKIDSINLI